MKAALAYTALAAEVATVLGQKVVHYPFHKVQDYSGNGRLSKRATNPIGVTITNAQTLYFVNATVGTPAQQLEMQLDTGSSDVWMSDSSASYCQGTQGAEQCQGGTFTPGQSSTYKALNTIFNITYVDGTGSTGNYFTDNFGIGGVTLDALEMGLATKTTIGTGIIGVGYAADEAVCNTEGPCPTYPSIIDNMVSQGKINTHAYSLWLDDVQAQTGSILFGGVDSAKYHAPLITLPVEQDQYSGSYTSFSVAFTGFTITKNGAVQTGFTSSGYTQQAILDSGTSLTLMPDALFTQLQQQVGATYSQEVGIYIADCSVAAVNATFDFSFGGTSGPIIHVPINEFVVPLINENGQAATFQNGKAACEFGMQPADGDPVLFGDTFLRSAYVVYDLDNNLISMANTNFNATGSNVQAISSGTNGVPGATQTATGGLGGATYTSNPFLGGSQSTATGNVGSSAVPTGALLTQGGSGASASATATSGNGEKSAGEQLAPAGIMSVLSAAFLAMAAML